MFGESLWKSKSNGRRRVILTLACLVLLIPSLIFVLISANGGHTGRTLVAVCITAIVIVATGVILLLGHFTSMKWDVANLEFAVADAGLFFTSLAHQDSYFHAEWDEIESYSAVPEKNGLTTVTVNFIAPLDAGSVGKIKYLKMVKISDFDTLKSVFSDKNKPEVKSK